MPMDTTKYNHKHQSFYQTYRPPYFWTRYISLLLFKISASILLDNIYILFTFQNIGLHTSGQDIDPSNFCKISASILLDKMNILFTFQNIGLHTSGTRYISFLLLQNIGLHTSGQDMTYSSEVHDKGDPFSKLLE